MIPPEAMAPQTLQNTEGITKQLENVSIESTTSRRPITGAPVRISVPLDLTSRPVVTPTALYAERKALRRDSTERREALLKGKEGSRQRRRWENGN